jgi:mono/diheme cytochrome c family protein
MWASESMSGLKTLWGAAVIPFAMLAGCRSLPPPTPLADLNPEQAHGHEVFEQRCSQCHYDRQDGPLHGPSLLSVFKKPYLPSGAAANDERVTATIVNGHSLMPAQPDISSQELDDVLAYLHTL